jgi:outer membrane protein OmpA-like peptidoglycan-associated protein
MSDSLITMGLKSNICARHLFMLLIFAVSVGLSGPVLACNETEANRWIDEGLKISKKLPNSEKEAECYRKALAACPGNASAHFNLAYVLDAQVVSKIRSGTLVWSDTDKLYQALEHYAASARFGAKGEDAYANSIRVSRILLDPPINRPPDLIFIRKQLLVCLESPKKGKGEASSQMQKIERLIRNIEEKLSKLYACTPENKILNEKEIAQALNRNFKRGRSPYKGPRVPIVIRFETNSARIEPKSAMQLKEIARALQSAALADQRIIIEGHTDSRGELGYNERLSRERAKSVKDYLDKKCGLVQDRFEIREYGETRPLVPNDSEEHWAMNRRVEFVNKNKLDGFLNQIRQRKRSGISDQYDLLY